MICKKRAKKITHLLAILAAIFSPILGVSTTVIVRNMNQQQLQEKRFDFLNKYGIQTFTKDGIKFLPDEPTPVELRKYRTELKFRENQLMSKIQNPPVHTSDLEEYDVIKELRKLERDLWFGNLSKKDLRTLCAAIGVAAVVIGYSSVWLIHFIIWFFYRLAWFLASDRLSPERNQNQGVNHDSPASQ